MSKKQKFYVVWRGHKSGIYDNWNAAKLQIDRFTGARYKSFSTYEEAKLAFEEGDTYARPDLKTPSSVEPNSISVDAACSGNPGIMEYRCVETISKKEIFRMGPFNEATNNIGEFLAIIHAAALLDKQGRHDLTIYTDSKTALSWIKNKKVKTTLERNSKNEDVWSLIERAQIWLLKNTIKNPLIKWPTEKWGEIPADFGRK